MQQSVNPPTDQTVAHPVPQITASFAHVAVFLISVISIYVTFGKKCQRETVL